MSYSVIKQNGYWKDTANALNYNFNRIDAELSELDGKVTKSKGLFKTDADLKSALPNPEEGDWALVGSTFPAQVWIEENGSWVNSGGTFGDSVDINLTEYLQSEKINDVSDILGADSLEVSLSITPEVVEYTGKNQPVTLTWSTMENGRDVRSLIDIFEITKDEVPLSDPAVLYSDSSNSNTISNEVNKEGTTVFTISAAKDGKNIKTMSVKYNQVRAMYFGTSTKESADEIIPEEFVKQSIKTSPVGEYVISNPGTKNYLWLCIPSNMNIYKVTLSEGNKEEIPMEVTVKDNYKLYRSSNVMRDGDVKIRIL